jgi:high affinity Mn2+ porin
MAWINNASLTSSNNRMAGILNLKQRVAAEPVSAETNETDVSPICRQYTPEKSMSLLGWLGGFAMLFIPVLCAAQAADTEEVTQAKLQSTYVWQRKPAFQAKFSGDNSLRTEREPRSHTLTATAFLGARVWEGAEFYFNPEMSSSDSLSQLHGLGGLTNGENQKGGGTKPTFYVARLFLRQTWGLGGGSEQIESAPNQLAGMIDKNRIVLTVGTVSLVDVFDNNAYSHDPRTQFLNWAIMTHGAFDYAADTRGYTSGAALEYYRNNYAFRIGRFMQPLESNGRPLDTHIFNHYGDQIEIERSHEINGQPGKLRLLAFRNRAFMAGFQDTLDSWRAGGRVGVPDISAVRKERTKVGWGVNLEQSIAGNVGLFVRASANDGKSETYAFTEIERSISGGVVVKGVDWGRPSDALGIAFVQNGISSGHRDYLANGGLGPFIGDGVPPAGTNYNYAPERILEVYYNVNLAKGTWASVDYQRAQNPAYNADRGPASFYGVRVHFEF